MAHVLIVGGGLSGCTASLELAKNGQKVTIIEKAENIGGKVLEFGCKSTENCKNCGVCLAGGLWEAVESNSSIEIVKSSRLVDVNGSKGGFKVTLKSSGGYRIIEKISSIIISIGFERSASESFGNLELAYCENIITGFQLEKLIAGRGRAGIIPGEPSNIAFIQCFGSRDLQEKADYCSRVCCAYSTRAARTVKHYNPCSKISFFYMDLQYVEAGQYYDLLVKEGFEFIKSRPVKIMPGEHPKVVYEIPESGQVVEREFDLIVLSEGIHPPKDAEHISELCTLDVDDKGFLKAVNDGSKTGIYIAGCASGPKRIEEAYAESLAVARQVLSDIEMNI